MAHLFNSINNIYHQPYVTLDDILNSSNSNSTLGKLYQGLYIPGSLTIDFHGFILCLQQIARTFNINLRILIKNLINT
ncbi:unnamed protein product [Rotaria sp. Silwood2]|nr:unnamed protein product [Rotaria sp. Silwood2]